MNTNEVLKLALEALENTTPTGFNMERDKQFFAAITALREALAEREAVLPGGGHVPAVPVAVYGYCPECGGAGVMRERRPNGDDKCTNGHKYPSSQALAEQPAQQEPVAIVAVDGFGQIQIGWIKKPQHNDKLYTSPPAQRTWVGLTRLQINQMMSDAGWQNSAIRQADLDKVEKVVRAIEAKLKEKNT